MNWYGDIDLGSDFYYMVEPTFNSIVIPVNTSNPFKSSIYVVRDIESIGYNNNYVIAISKGEKELKYWLIDKDAKTEKLGYKENSIMQLSNVAEIDSLKFNQIMNIEKIVPKSKNQYRKEHNYE